MHSTIILAAGLAASLLLPKTTPAPSSPFSPEPPPPLEGCTGCESHSAFYSDVEICDQCTITFWTEAYTTAPLHSFCGIMGAPENNCLSTCNVGFRLLTTMDCKGEQPDPITADVTLDDPCGNLPGPQVISPIEVNEIILWEESRLCGSGSSFEFTLNLPCGSMGQLVASAQLACASCVIE